MPSLQLVSLNIEGRKHLDRIKPFLLAQMPDVVCLQEVCRQDILYFEQLLGGTGFFAPMQYSKTWKDEVGIGVFSTHTYEAVAYWYGGKDGEIVPVDATSFENRYHTTSFTLIVAEILRGDQTITIGTTHFPVTENGDTTDYQREALAGLLTQLKQYPEIVFCGDFNAPRGREIFSTLAEQYTDNVPLRYSTSIDGNLHRAGQLPHMVDGIFSTSGYSVRDVKMVCGVSDHCALVAKIAVREI